MREFSFSILIATHGAEEWGTLARTRAYPSAAIQDAPVFMEHDPDGDRAQVRNHLAGQADSDLLIFLDGDDQLEAGYVEAMAKTATRDAEKWPFLLTPQVSYIDKRGRVEAPRFWPEVPIRRGNWMVVGTAVPRELFLEVGGWRSLRSTGMLNEYDDWDLWIRCQLNGATPVRVPGAIYTAHIRTNSLHRTVPTRQKIAWTKEIQRLNWPDEVFA